MPTIRILVADRARPLPPDEGGPRRRGFLQYRRTTGARGLLNDRLHMSHDRFADQLRDTLEPGHASRSHKGSVLIASSRLQH